MSPSKRKVPRVISLIRLGNPWMVGHNVSRIVPVHAIQSFASTVFKASKELQAVRDLARGSTPNVEAFPCFNGWHPPLDQQRLLQDCMFALLAPDRRVFRTKKGPGIGSVTPLVAGLCDGTTGSDDGLGKRMARLLEATNGKRLTERLERLFAPAMAKDPATAAAMALLGGDSSSGLKEHDEESTLQTPTELEASVANFVATLLVDVDDARRLQAIQDFGRGLYFGAVWLLVAGQVSSKGASVRERGVDTRFVLVYAGMPPGNPHDPLVLAAARSLQRMVTLSWDGLASEMTKRLNRVRVPSSTRPKDEWEERIRAVFSDLRKGVVDELIDWARDIPRRRGEIDEVWAREFLEEAGLDSGELGRRIRSLAANIGFAGPDRGRGLPRLYCETPLLGTLVRGLCGAGSMPFEEFVSRLRERFGLVFGPGNDESLAEKLGPVWGGAEGDELLRQNQEEFRRRLVRAGLARTYSDLHTEVSARG